MLLLGSIIVTLVVAGLIYTINRMFEDRKSKIAEVAEGVVVGMIAGFCNFFAPKTANLSSWSWVLAIPIMLIMLVCMVGLGYRWKQNGSTLKEMLWFLILGVIFTFIAKAAGAVVAAHSGTFAFVILLIPTAFLFGLIAFMLFNLIQFKAEQCEDELPWMAKALRAIPWVAAILIVALVIRGAWGQLTGRINTTDGAAKISIFGGAKNEDTAEAEAAEVADAGMVDETTEVVAAEATETEEAMEAEENVEIAENAEMAEVETSENVVEAETGTPIEIPDWVHFYNSDLDHTDQKVFQNFGPNPMLDNVDWNETMNSEIEKKGVKATIKVEDVLDEIDVETIVADHKERLRNDPALGAADMAWFDSIMGTRYLGVFYDECDSQWDAAMNKAKEEWMADHDAYNRTLDAFFQYLDMAVEVKIRKDTGLTDQMYMNPFTPDGVPDVVVLESEDHDGRFLVYKFPIKGTTMKEIKYRLDCGYQPTNVAKVMNVKPGKNPNKKVVQSKPTQKKKQETKQPETPTVQNNPGGGNEPSGGGETESGGGGGEDTDHGSGGEDTDHGKGGEDADHGSGGENESSGGGGEVTYNKDKTKGTPVKPNDDSGPGPNTNNGVGAQYSTEDKDTNSNHMTKGEYEETMDNLEKINETQKVGGDSNKPSTPTPADTKVDSNAENGTGNGGIDKPTEVTEKAQTVDNTPVTSSDGDGAWGGPSN